MSDQFVCIGLAGKPISAKIGSPTRAGAAISFLFLAIVFLFALSGYTRAPAVLHVPGDFDTIGAALAVVPDHGIIEVASGNYAEALVIQRPLTLRSADGSAAHLSGTDDEPIIQVIGTEDVIIEGLTLSGGKHGIFVTRSQDVTIRENRILSSRLAGIKVRLGAANIYSNTILEADAPYGVGIHITNTTQWPASHIFGNTVSGHARSGILTNMTSMVYVENNTVTDNHQHGVAITEMSHARVAQNTVDRNVENGIYVVDMSMASVCDNVVTNTLPSESDRGIRYGNGILIDFHSMAEVHNNIVVGNANHGVQELFASHLVVTSNDVQRNGVDELPQNTVYRTGAGPVDSPCGEAEDE